MIKVPIEMPEDCFHCPFFFDEHYMYTDKVNLGYIKIARCRFAPEEVEDPWRNIHKVYGHKEEWCPLEEVED